MKIYTSYFANLKNIPDNIVPISICRRSPKGYDGIQIACSFECFIVGMA